MATLIKVFRLGLLQLDFFRNIFIKDFRAGFVVGIIALPMSIGIAIASGFPPFAGIISSLIGGLLISFISGSRICIKGPAGGLCALTLSAVTVLGEGDIGLGYQYTLAVIILSGVLQIFSAFAKMGKLGDFFPAAVIHAMLASLGFIMVLKQLPYLIGAEVYTQKPSATLGQLHILITKANPKITLIGLVCLTALIAHHFLPKKIAALLPSVLLTLIVGIPAALLLHLDIPHTYSFASTSYFIQPAKVLVDFPIDFLQSLGTPNFTKIGTLEFWFFCVAFSLAGNIESLLTCKVIDKIDPWHRQSDFNKDLMAIGMGNMLCGLFGGLPIISESKRSLANVEFGGGTYISNFFHAVTLLFLLSFALPIIRLIPIAALAAYLIYAGVRMTLPKEFSKSYSIGKEQLLVFTVVFILTVTYDLIVGVVVGTLLELAVNIRFGAKLGSLFSSNLKIMKQTAYQYEVKVEGPAIFSNFIMAKKSLQTIPSGANILFDFTHATVVDHSFLENLYHFEASLKNEGGTMAITGMEFHSQVSGHPLASRRIITPEATPRTMELKEFSDRNAYDFDIRRITHPIKYQQFNLRPAVHVIRQENTIKFETKSYLVEICDVHFESEAPNKQSFTTTLILISPFAKNFPEFILQQEGFHQGLFDIEKTRDLNFDEHPIFSYYYYLTGMDEDEIWEYFQNSGLIPFFELNKGYHLNAVGGLLLLYKRLDVLSIAEIEKTLIFINELLDRMEGV